MTDHEHEWEVGVGDGVFGTCKDEKCNAHLDWDELEAMLNEHTKLNRVQDAVKDIARMASNQGKSPDHEAALIILLNIGDACIDALAEGDDDATHSHS